MYVVDALFRSRPMNQLRRAGVMGTGGGLYLMRHLCDVDTYAGVGGVFDYVYKQRRLYFGYFGGGFDHGYKRQRTPLVAGIDNVYNPLCLKSQAILSRR